MIRTMYGLLPLLVLLLVSCRTQKTVEQVDIDQPDAGIVEEVELVYPVDQVSLKEVSVEDAPIDVSIIEDKVIPRELVKPEINKMDADMAARIVRWKRRTDRSVWWECGKRYKTKEEFQKAALEWATAVNKAYNNTSYKLRSGKVIKVNKSEALGIMMRETRLDRCAVGPYPRKFAYANKIIQRRDGSLSHTMEELEKVFTHRKFQGRLADIGPGQIVKRIGGKGKKSIKWETIKEFLTVEPGVQMVFDEMADRGRMYSTRTPSNKWPGNGPNAWYTNNVLRMGSKITKERQRYIKYKM